MLCLKVGVCMGDQRPGLAQTKPQLTEEPLALPHPQRDAVPLVDEGGQSFPVPQTSHQAKVFWSLAQSFLELVQLFLPQSTGAPRPLSIYQAGQPFLLEAMYPIFHSPWRIPQQAGHLAATHPLGYQQQSVQTVVVTRFPRTTDLILQSKDHSVSIRDLEFSHA